MVKWHCSHVELLEKNHKRLGNVELLTMGKLRIERTHKRKKKKEKENVENLLKVKLQVQFSHAVTVNPHELYFEA